MISDEMKKLSDREYALGLDNPWQSEIDASKLALLKKSEPETIAYLKQAPEAEVESLSPIMPSLLKITKSKEELMAFIEAVARCSSETQEILAIDIEYAKKALGKIH